MVQNQRDGYYNKKISSDVSVLLGVAPAAAPGHPRPQVVRHQVGEDPVVVRADVVARPPAVADQRIPGVNVRALVRLERVDDPPACSSQGYSKEPLEIGEWGVERGWAETVPVALRASRNDWSADTISSDEPHSVMKSSETRRHAEMAERRRRSLTLGVGLDVDHAAVVVLEVVNAPPRECLRVLALVVKTPSGSGAGRRRRGAICGAGGRGRVGASASKIWGGCVQRPNLSPRWWM